MKPTRYYSNRQETKVAKSLGARKTPNSGATKWIKGDIQNDKWLFECKTVTKEQQTFTIKKEWITKNKEEAFAMRKSYNALIFDFGDSEEYVVLDIKTFKNLIDNN